MEAHGLLFEYEGGGLGLPYARLKLKRTPDGRVGFTHPDQPEASVWVADLRILETLPFRQVYELRAQVRAERQQVEGRRALRLAVIFLVTFLAVVGVASLGTRLVAGFLVSRVSVVWEKKIGAEALDGLSEKMTVTNVPVLVHYLESLAGQLRPGLPPHPYQFQFLIADLPWPNAFACPGGTIVVTTGLFRFAESPEEIAGVLAHEMAHVLHRHGLEELILGTGPYHVLRVFLGDEGGMMTLLGAGTHLLLTQSRSRAHEEEADASGWSYMQAAGLDPRGHARLMARVANDPWLKLLDSIPLALRSHPRDAERLATLNALWAKSRQPTRFKPLPPLPAPTEWRELD